MTEHRLVVIADGVDSVERFAEKNSISRAQAFKEIAAGRLVARKIAGRTVITSEDAAAWRRNLPIAPPREAANGAANKRKITSARDDEPKALMASAADTESLGQFE